MPTARAFAAFTFASTLALSGAARADESVARARFTTSASAADVRRAACSLDAKAEMGGRPQAIALTVDGAACPGAALGALALEVRTAPSERGLVVAVDSNVTAASEDTTLELRDVVTAVGLELRRRVSSPAPAAAAPAPALATAAPAQTRARAPHATAGPGSAARVAAIVGGSVLAAGAAVGTVSLVVAAVDGLSGFSRMRFFDFGGGVR